MYLQYRALGEHYLNMSSEETKGVVRALGNSEDHFADCMNFTGMMNIVYCIEMSTKKQLTDSMMFTSLQNWRKVFPMLRMSIVERDGVKYFQEMNKDVVDYKRVDGEWRGVYHELLHARFSKEGPLWLVRLVPQSSSAPNVYKYAVVVSWMHVITDGTSNIRMCNRLAEIIDSTIEGSTVIYSDEAEVMPACEALLPQKEYTWKEVLPSLREMLGHNGSTIWGQTFPVNKESEYAMHFFDMGSLTEEESGKLVRRCKREKVTVNSALANAANRAVFAELKNGGAEGETFNLMTSHAVSLRRYYELDQDVYGFNVGLLNLSSAVSVQDMGDFWPTTKKLGNDVIDALNKGDLQKEILTVNTLFDMETMLAQSSDQSATQYDVCFSNLRDVTRMFPGKYKNVEVTWLCRSTACQHFGVPLQFNFTTFRGRLLCSVDVNTWYCSTEQASNIGKLTMDTLRSAISQ